MLLTSHAGLRGGAGIGELLGQHRIGDTSQMLIEHNERVAPVTCSHSNRTLECRRTDPRERSSRLPSCTCPRRGSSRLTRDAWHRSLESRGKRQSVNGLSGHPRASVRIQWSRFSSNALLLISWICEDPRATRARTRDPSAASKSETWPVHVFPPSEVELNARDACFERLGSTM